MPLVFRGAAEFPAHLRRMVVQQEAMTHLALEQAGKKLREDIVDNLMLKEHPPHTKTPSQKGEPPAMILGGLKASVHATQVVRAGPTRFHIKVGPTKVYARIQELGGTAGRGARLPRRPYVKPAVKKIKPVFMRIVLMHWRIGHRG